MTASTESVAADARSGDAVGAGRFLAGGAPAAASARAHARTRSSAGARSTACSCSTILRGALEA
ncbi:hypothetical protein [Streptomyces sp. NBC_00057]|uniref:hypothetical protein n=1 Tax=Streptomyces sp. NBC_00057 TaxID=2975634 RepID=UPI00324FADF4